MNLLASVHLSLAWVRIPVLGATALLAGSPLAIANPPVVPQLGITQDPLGALGNYQPAGPTLKASSAFFQDLGTNGRTCESCHQSREGWSISATGVQDRFTRSRGADPIFRLVDGATCPTDDVSTPEARAAAYTLLLQKGLIRIGLPMPPTGALEFEVTAVNDPYQCNTNSTTGLTSKTTGVVSVYRRPLPSTNLGFLGAIMWDEREPSLESQAINATLGHAQATIAPSAAQLKQIVDFESGVFTAQLIDLAAERLDVDGANGGPVTLSSQVASFTIGENNPAPLPGTKVINPNFNPNIFNLYASWISSSSLNVVNPVEVIERERQASIARGEVVFNTTKFMMSGVAGVNDDSGVPVVPAVCGNCHNTPNVGTHSLTGPVNIGIANPDASTAPTLDKAGLPVFTLTCTSGPLAGQVYSVTDPGRALISGKCKDIGRFKTAGLRGLAARAPYFHDGSATTLRDVVDFYDKRFTIGYTEQQKIDLVNFLGSL